MSVQSPSTSVAVLVLQAAAAAMMMIIMLCCCCGRSSSSSSYENMDLCDNNDPDGRCSGSDSTGRCNANDFDGGVNFQASVLAVLAVSNYYDNGRRSGCIRLPTTPTVYTYYCCSRFVDGCEHCFAKAVKRLKDGCAGRAGGSVLFDKCSLRYETDDFCGISIY